LCNELPVCVVPRRRKRLPESQAAAEALPRTRLREKRIITSARSLQPDRRRHADGMFVPQPHRAATRPEARTMNLTMAWAHDGFRAPVDRLRDRRAPGRLWMPGDTPGMRLA